MTSTFFLFKKVNTFKNFKKIDQKKTGYPSVVGVEVISSLFFVF